MHFGRALKEFAYKMWKGFETLLGHNMKEGALYERTIARDTANGLCKRHQREVCEVRRGYRT